MIAAATSCCRPGVLITVAVAAVDHNDLREVCCAQQTHSSIERNSIEVRSALAAAAKHEMRVRITSGFQDRRRAFFGERGKYVTTAARP
jgi:hypothetical protein